jgi:peptidoglycan hydrolase CwlO-like protein
MYDKLKKERDLRHEERVRWEAELQGAENQLDELKKKIKEELDVEPDQLESEVSRLEAEIKKLIQELEVLLPARG